MVRRTPSPPELTVLQWLKGFCGGGAHRHAHSCNGLRRTEANAWHPNPKLIISVDSSIARPASSSSFGCTGAFFSARIGLPQGRRATVRGALRQGHARPFPRHLVEGDRIFINEGSAWTYVGLNVAVALIERIWAPKWHIRGRRSQHFELLDLTPSSDRIQGADPRTQSPGQPADRGRVGRGRGAIPAPIRPRQVSRAFRAETGQSPADQRYVTLRLDCTQDEGLVRVNLIRTKIAALRLGCRGVALKD